jgi:hypothetical protein
MEAWDSGQWGACFVGVFVMVVFLIGHWLIPRFDNISMLLLFDQI